MATGSRGAEGHPAPTGEQLQAILELCRKMNAERDLPALLTLVAREGARLMEAALASILLLDLEKCELWSSVTLDGQSIRFDARLGIAGEAALTGRTINVFDAQEDPRFYQAVDQRTRVRTKSILAVPMRNSTGEVIGVFEVMNKKHGAFTAADEEVAQALAAQAALAVEAAQVLQTLRRDQELLQAENAQLRKEVERRFSTRNIVGTSPQLQSIVRLIDEISDTAVNVLITGESGTGKEMVAKAIHYCSPRASRPFVALNCAALPENLVESELFGHERGAFTGADQRRIGRFEQAHEGTLFLDEIGDLSLTAQAKILRALQERVIERVGGRTPVPVDVRIIAATHVDLEAAIAQGRFREDLYYRLKVILIRMPALREVRSDVPLLANYFLDKYCREVRREPKRFSAAAMRRLTDYAWPGNTRQLENEIRRLVVSVRRQLIGEEDLPEPIRLAADDTAGPPTRASGTLKDRVNEIEKQAIREALRASGYNQVQAARTLGLSRQGLIKKMKRYGISGKPS